MRVLQWIIGLETPVDATAVLRDDAGQETAITYRWLIGLAADDEVQDHSTFNKNRDRLPPWIVGADPILTPCAD